MSPSQNKVGIPTSRDSDRVTIHWISTCGFAWDPVATAPGTDSDS